MLSVVPWTNLMYTPSFEHVSVCGMKEISNTLKTCHTFRFQSNVWIDLAVADMENYHSVSVLANLAIVTWCANNEKLLMNKKSLFFGQKHQ